MRIGAYRFRPSLWPTLAVVLLLPLLLGLGVWQLDRAAQKQALLDSMATAGAAEPLALLDLRPDYDAVRHRRAAGAGEYDGERQFLLENQIRDGLSGYQVLTPLQLADGRALLVDRGWVPAPALRSRLPEIETPAGERQVRGRLDSGPAVGLKLGAAAAEAQGWPQRLQYLDYDHIAESLPYPILPYLLRLDPDLPDGYRRDWEPAPRMGPATHHGYAVQWFGLALALLVIYVAVNLKRDGD